MFQNILQILYYLIPIIIGNESEEPGIEKRNKVIEQFLKMIETKEFPFEIPRFLIPFLKSFLGICIDYLVKYLHNENVFEHLQPKKPQ